MQKSCPVVHNYKTLDLVKSINTRLIFIEVCIIYKYTCTSCSWNVWYIYFGIKHRVFLALLLTCAHLLVSTQTRRQTFISVAINLYLPILQSAVFMIENNEYCIFSFQFKSHCQLRITTQGIKSEAGDSHYYHPKYTSDDGNLYCSKPWN